MRTEMKCSQVSYTAPGKKISIRKRVSSKANRGCKPQISPAIRACKGFQTRCATVWLRVPLAPSRERLAYSVFLACVGFLVLFVLSRMNSPKTGVCTQLLPYIFGNIDSKTMGLLLSILITLLSCRQTG